MIRLIKRIVVYFFGKGPRKVASFFELTKNHSVGPIDRPEHLTNVLKHETGNIVIFKPFNNTFEVPFIHRKIKQELRYKNGGIFKEADRVLFSLGQGCIFGSLGIVYDAQTRKAISESAQDWLFPLENHSFFSSWRFNKPVKKRGTALSIASTGSDGGYYHFLHESFPKLDFCKELLENIDYVLVPGAPLNWKSKLLSTAGIPLNKIIWLSPTDHYQFDQLLFTNRLMFDQQFTKTNIQSIRNILNFRFSPIAVSERKIIWSSRANTSHRAFRWESMVKTQFPEIEFVDFGNLTMEETMLKCQSCHYFIGPHGAGFSNLIFCRPQTYVLEIFPNFEFQPLYNRLSQVCELNHFAIMLDFDNFDNTPGLSYLEIVLRKLFSLNFPLIKA